jgi:hypothetical protein
MGFFSSLFGSSADKYPQDEHQLSEYDIKKIINREHIETLDDAQAQKVRIAILARRRGDGKISLRQIYEVLQHMVNTYVISKFDRDGVMKVMQKFFAEHHIV